MLRYRCGSVLTTRPNRVRKVVAEPKPVSVATLVGIAVLLKHLNGNDVAVAVMGQVHGIAFIFYLWMVASMASEVGRLVIAAFVPFAVCQCAVDCAQGGGVVYLLIKSVHFSAVTTFVGGLLMLSVAVGTPNLAVQRVIRRWDRRVTVPALLIVLLVTLKDV